MKKYALISVYDKTGIVDFARFLVEEGFGLLSTGGSYNVLSKANVPVTRISAYTGNDEILDGRVKTLHPRIYGGILGRRDDKNHLETMQERDINPIDIVVVNLYPFFEKSGAGLPLHELVEFIDIGGPTLIRAAAKNHAFVTVLTDPADYRPLMEEWRLTTGHLLLETRRHLAGKVFSLTGAYDSAIAHSLLGDEEAPDLLSFSFKKTADLRYGENPHQKAAWYVPSSPSAYGALSCMKQHQGKQLSFNNLRDLNGAWCAVSEFDTPACVAVKHGAPCGAAVAATSVMAWEKAWAGDPVSIFGGIVAFNREVNEEAALSLCSLFLEVIAAPHYSEGALDVFKKKKNLRVLTLSRSPSDQWEALPVDGGICLQTVDKDFVPDAKWSVPTRIQPSAQLMPDLIFAWRMVKHVKSNGIVLATDGALVGVGGGQPNRVGAIDIAVAAAGSKAQGAVLASDAFFPFDDAVKAAVKAGVVAIIQPGGSMRDEDSIKACDEANITMIFTGRRHFRH